MAAEVSSIARMLRGEAGKGGRAGAGKAPEMVTMDLLGGCGGVDEVVDLEVKVPAGWERRLDLLSGKTFLTPHRHQAAQDGHQDVNLPPTASTTPAPAAAAVTTASAGVCTLDMVRYALECAAAARSARSPDTSSSSLASTSSSSSSLGKRSRSPPSSTAASPAANPAMRACACPSCFMYVLIAEADPWCPRCASKVPPLPSKPAAHSRGKKPKIDLNADADETE